MSTNNNSSRNWKHAFALLVFIMLALVGIVFYADYNIDENAFCLNKVKLNFPEYNVQLYNTDGFKAPDKCVVHATDSIERRDGLLRLNNIDATELKFALVDEFDKAYLAQDDAPTFWMGLLVGFSILGIFVTVTNWMER